jgi:2-dehydro-3-deoxygluconokinase
VGGLLYGILRDWQAAKWIQFGWATGALATTMLTDYAQPADEEQVWSIWKGIARVKR